jgi:hypothetical protein
MDSVTLIHKAVLERELQSLKLKRGDVDLQIVIRWIESRLQEIERD